MSFAVREVSSKSLEVFKMGLNGLCWVLLLKAICLQFLSTLRMHDCNCKGRKGCRSLSDFTLIISAETTTIYLFLIIYWKPTYETLCKALGIQWWGRHSPALKELTFYRWTGKFSTVIIQRNKCDDIGTHGTLWNHSVISNSAQEKSKESWAWKSEQVLVEWQCSQWQRRTLCANSTCKRAEVGEHLSGASADGEQRIRSKE